MMRKNLFVVSIVMVFALLLSGCSNNESKSSPVSSEKAEKQKVPTLEEVISGTWKVYAGFDQSGAKILSDQPDFNIAYSLTFNANGGFSGEYREKSGYVETSFTGAYDVTDSKLAGQDPYKWYYYSTISRADLKDSGDYSFAARLPSEYSSNTDSIYLSFEFRELDGEEMLFENAMRLYFKKQ